jgi:hypothetical protein
MGMTLRYSSTIEFLGFDRTPFEKPTLWNRTVNQIEKVGSEVKAFWNNLGESGHVRIGKEIIRPEAFAPAQESGLTKKLQTSIVNALEEGEIVGVRKRAYGANFLDDKYPSKPLDAVVKKSYKNGVRVLENGERVVSDVDLAFVVKDRKVMPESHSIDIGNRINNSYRKIGGADLHDVVKHGDNYWGVQKGVEKAIDISERNETIYVFDKNGFVDSGKYQDMIKKYLGTERR